MNPELSYILIPSGLVALIVAVVVLSRRRVQLRSGENWVPCYDFRSKTVAYVAREKLRPGMVQARIHGIDGQVWVDPAQMKAEKYQHPPLDEPARERLRAVVERLREVHPLTVEQWEERIRHDPQPEREIARWNRIADAYARELAGHDYNLPQKRDLLQVILACSGTDHVQALKAMRLDALARTTAEQIAARCADLAENGERIADSG
jgi:hypothetical protein